MKVIDFLNIKGQQKFEEKNLNPIEIRIENDRVQNILEIYKKNVARLRLEGLLFLSRIQHKTDKIFVVTTGIPDAKYLLINNSYQIIDVVNLNKIKKWDEIKNSSCWVMLVSKATKKTDRQDTFRTTLKPKTKAIY